MTRTTANTAPTIEQLRAELADLKQQLERAVFGQARAIPMPAPPPVPTPTPPPPCATWSDWHRAGYQPHPIAERPD